MRIAKDFDIDENRTYREYHSTHLTEFLTK